MLVWLECEVQGKHIKVIDAKNLHCEKQNKTKHKVDASADER